jgi:hypothetical protein
VLCAGDAPVAKKFFFLYSVNNAGFIDVCGCKMKKVKQGSLARRFTMIKQLRAQPTPFLLLDGGSCFFDVQGSTPKDEERAQLQAKAFVIVESYNRMGYKALAMGSADLLLGIDELKRLAAAAQFPFLCANFVGPDGKLVFAPSIIAEVGGARIGIVGVVMGTLGIPYLAKVAPGYTVTDPIAAVARAVAELKGKVDLIVALSHCRKEENQALAKAVPELSIIFDPNINYGSHSIFMAEPNDNVDRFEKTLVVRADGEGMRLARVDMEVEVPLGEVHTSPDLNRLDNSLSADPLPEDLSTVLGRGDYNRAVITRLSVEPHFPADPGIALLVDMWKQQDPGKIDPQALAALKGAPVVFAGKDACAKCHKPQYENWLKTKHGSALASLKENNDHLRYDCIGCHTLGFGTAFIDVKEADKFADVQCESCHGANPAHVEDPEKNPTWPKIGEQACLTCHNEHQTRIPFDFQSKLPKVKCPPTK